MGADSSPNCLSILDIGKAYKSILTKCGHDKNSSNKVNKAEAEAKLKTLHEAFRVLSGKKRDDDITDAVPKTPSTNNKKNNTNTIECEDDMVISKPVLLSRIRSPRDIFNGSFSRCYSGNKRPSSAPTTPTRTSVPIIYSRSMTMPKRKPPPVERSLECKLEELLHGCIMMVPVTRDVITDVGQILQKEEMLRIRVEPGWRKGTKVTFEGKGDEKPGTLPADLIFVIQEKRHPIFDRIGDDLELGVEFPLVQSLTGCSNIDVPLIDGEKISVSVDEEIIYPGYEKIIPGQGMPKFYSEEGRGNLCLKFFVKFPNEMSHEQRSKVFCILNDCCY